MGHLIFGARQAIWRSSGYYVNKASNLNSVATVKRMFSPLRVIRASGCCYYCEFLRDHRRPEAYHLFREKAASLCFRS